MTVTQTDDEEGRDDRGSIEASYLRYPWQEVFINGAGRFETNKSLGIELRSQIGAAIGPRLVNSNRGYLSIGGGLRVQPRTGCGRRANSEHRGARDVQDLVLYVRSTENRAERQLRLLPKPEQPRPSAPSARCGRPARACSRTCSSRSICTTLTTAGRQVLRRTRMTSVSSCPLAGPTSPRARGRRLAASIDTSIVLPHSRRVTVLSRRTMALILILALAADHAVLCASWMAMRDARPEASACPMHQSDAPSADGAPAELSHLPARPPAARRRHRRSSAIAAGGRTPPRVSGSWSRSSGVCRVRLVDRVATAGPVPDTHVHGISFSPYSSFSTQPS